MERYQEVLDEFKHIVYLNYNGTQLSEYLENVKTLQEAVDKANKYDEKETPKKPIPYLNSLFQCGNCKGIFQNHHYQNRCPNCGQKLDWSDRVCQTN